VLSVQLMAMYARGIAMHARDGAWPTYQHVEVVKVGVPAPAAPTHTVACALACKAHLELIGRVTLSERPVSKTARQREWAAAQPAPFWCRRRRDAALCTWLSTILSCNSCCQNGVLVRNTCCEFVVAHLRSRPSRCLPVTLGLWAWLAWLKHLPRCLRACMQPSARVCCHLPASHQPVLAWLRNDDSFSSNLMV